MEAFRLLDAGRLEQASSPFDAVIDLRKKARAQRSIDEALDDIRLLEEAALYDRLAFNIDSAVQRYIEAAALSADSDLSYLSAKAKNHLDFGRDKNDNTSLLISVGLLRALVLKIDRAESSLAWASVQNRIGNVLSLLGSREASSARLHEAIDTYNSALEEYASLRLSQDWAAVQNNIAIAYRSLGERDASTGYLKMARKACIEALEMCPRSLAREQWANIQLNLGNACTLLGGRDNNIQFLKEGIRAYRKCLSERSRAIAPQAWAQVHTNLGNAFCEMAVKFGAGGRSNAAIKWLGKAIDAYSKALSETHREVLPLKWADLQHNVGNSLFMLGAALWLRGEPEPGMRHLQSAITALREALHERTFEKVPLRWAGTQEILGDTLLFVGDVEKRPEQLEEAILIFRGCVAQGTPDHDARRVAALNDKISTAQSLLAGNRDKGWSA
jgi:tetratricopeptide (TPR) repeat protein